MGLRANKPIILLEDHNFMWHQSDIDKVVELHNNGIYFTRIAKQVRCSPTEVLLVLIHVASEGKTGIAPIARVKASRQEVI